MPTTLNPMFKTILKIRLRCRAVLAAAALSYIACGAASPVIAAEATPTAALRVTHQQHFATPEAAVQALVAALRSDDTQRIHRVLGPGSSKLIRSGDAVADDQARDRFVAAFEQQWKIEPDGDARATLLLGDKEWPLPFPLLKAHGRWTFDARSGAEEILNRRIGRNELGAIQVCLAYVDAQREYALTDGNSNGVHDYAMKLESTPGKRDGLYWPTEEGQPPSSLGTLIAKAKAEGYGSGLDAPYQGYFYKVLTGQGNDASGGAYDYVVNGEMIGGFALLAYPARWGASGVMSFIVNHDGVVFQANLGRDTARLAGSISRFNPDSIWTKVRQ
jgi:hypothetical protein